MEKISAFMDGEVDGVQVQGQITRLKEDAVLRESWDAYHLIGDTLRGERKLMSRDFTEKFRIQLATEPTVLAPRLRSPVPVMVRRFALPEITRGIKFSIAKLGGQAVAVGAVAYLKKHVAPTRAHG